MEGRVCTRQVSSLHFALLRQPRGAGRGRLGSSKELRVLIQVESQAGVSLCGRWTLTATFGDGESSGQVCKAAGGGHI